MGVGSKWGVQTGHRCFCTAAEENIRSFNVTWSKKNSCQGSFLSFYLSHTETRRYNSLTAGHPKITAGNVRLQSARWGQERWAAHFVVHHRLPLTTFPTPHAVRQDEDRRPAKTVTPWHQEHIAMYTCWKAVHCSSLHILLWIVTNCPAEGDMAQTHWQPQNSLWLIQALHRPEEPKLVHSILLMMVAMQTGGKIYVGAKY